jgi:hypothetical protein
MQSLGSFFEIPITAIITVPYVQFPPEYQSPHSGLGSAELQDELEVRLSVALISGNATMWLRATMPQSSADAASIALISATGWVPGTHDRTSSLDGTSKASMFAWTNIVLALAALLLLVAFGVLAFCCVRKRRQQKAHDWRTRSIFSSKSSDRGSRIALEWEYCHVFTSSCLTLNNAEHFTSDDAIMFGFDNIHANEYPRRFAWSLSLPPLNSYS